MHVASSIDSMHLSKLVTLEGTLVVVLEMVQPASAGVVMHVSSKVIF